MKTPLEMSGAGRLKSKHPDSTARRFFNAREIGSMLRSLLIVLGIIAGALIGFFGGDLYYRITDPNPSAASQGGMLQGIMILLYITPASAIVGGIVGAIWPIRK